MGKSALTGALIYGLSAAVPPVGAVAIPAYTAYNYSKLGYSLYRVYEEQRTKGGASSNSIKRASGSVGEVATQSSADWVAGQVAAKAHQSGIFNEAAKATGVESIVFAEMVRGSTSSALSTSGGELFKFAIAKAVGG